MNDATENALPVIALVGRPNVGKSTLVNRIVGSRAAVTQEMPGVTRDRREFTTEWNGRSFMVVDTGGWQPDSMADTRQGGLVAEIRGQAESAIAQADLVILVVDAQGAVSAEDAAVAEMLRAASGRVLVAANKSDNQATALQAGQFFQLGLGEPYPVSAIHGDGVADLLDEAVSRLGQPVAGIATVPEIPQIAIVGRPNVGKSTLLNRLAGEERVVVSPVPGTTRDPIDIKIELDGYSYQVIDTAGIRRRPKIKEDVEFFAVLRARDVVKKADATLLLIDAQVGVSQQDQRIAQEIVSAGASLVILLNKWDVADRERREQTTLEVGDRLGFAGWAPVLRISAMTGARMHRLGPTLQAVLETRHNRIPTGKLNRLVTDWVEAHPPPLRKGRRPRIMYAVQTKSVPPTVVLFVKGGLIDDTYLRYLEGRLRQVCDFTGTPVRLITRRGAKPDRFAA